MNKKMRLILNSLGGGPSTTLLLDADMDPGVLRPWRHPNGKSYLTLRTGEVDNAGRPRFADHVTNAPALLSRADWELFDQAVEWQDRETTGFWDEMYAANPYNIENGLGELSVRRFVAGGEADARLSMDPIRRSERTRAILDTATTPLPVWHSDGNFTARDIAVARRSRLPLDTTGLKMAVTAIKEQREKLCLGLSDTFEFEGGTIYGATNFPFRQTMTLTSPEAVGWGPNDTVNELLEAIFRLQEDKFFGPYNLYYSNRWGMFFNRDYSENYGDRSLNSRLKEITNIKKMMALDFLPDFTMLLVQMNSKVVRAIQGMPITPIQWTGEGGMEVHWKVMSIQVPEFRETFDDNAGIIHLTSASPTTTTTTTA